VTHQTVNTNIPNKFKCAQDAANRIKVLSTMLVQMNEDKDTLMNDIIATDSEDEQAIDCIGEMYDRLLDDIQYNKGLQEELKAFIAVGYPACKTTNLSCVQQEYEENMAIISALNGN